VHAKEIADFQPDFDAGAMSAAPGSAAYLVQKGDETVGVVVIETEGTTAQVRLDYVTPRYRDFSPGEFVWRRSGMLRGAGIVRVVSPPNMVDAYYDKVGFRHEGPSYVLDLAGPDEGN
jgi:hypothetical protein